MFAKHLLHIFDHTRDTVIARADEVVAGREPLDQLLQALAAPRIDAHVVTIRGETGSGGSSDPGRSAGHNSFFLLIHVLFELAYAGRVQPAVIIGAGARLRGTLMPGPHKD